MRRNVSFSELGKPLEIWCMNSVIILHYNNWLEHLGSSLIGFIWLFIIIDWITITITDDLWLFHTNNPQVAECVFCDIFETLEDAKFYQ